MLGHILGFLFTVGMLALLCDICIKPIVRTFSRKN